jgi:hypothetical protein
MSKQDEKEALAYWTTSALIIVFIIILIYSTCQN